MISIFGMNVQQINDNGHNMGAVVATASIAFLITGMTWLLVSKANRYEPWFRTVLLGRGAHYAVRATFEERVFMLVFLAKKKHWKWMIATGAWWRILVDSKSRMPPVNDAMRNWYNLKDHEREDWQQRKQACDYMFLAFAMYRMDNFRPFRMREAADDP